MSLDAQLSYLTVDLGILRCTEAQETYLRRMLNNKLAQQKMGGGTG